MNFKIFFFSICIFAATTAFSQQVKKDSVQEKKSETGRMKYRKVKIGVDYASDNTFRGRKDSTNIPLVSPFFKYTGRRGWFTTVSLADVPAKKQKAFDELDLGAGKNFDFSENWDGTLSYTHYFFDAKAARIKAAVQNDIHASVNYDWTILYSQVIFDVNGGSDKFLYKGKKIGVRNFDYSFTFANQHDFEINFKDEKKMLTISPEADVLFGTQNFLAAYKGKTSDVNFKKQAEKFSLTAYVFYARFVLDLHKFSLDLSPSYTIPKNVPGNGSSSAYFVMYTSAYWTFKSHGK